MAIFDQSIKFIVNFKIIPILFTLALVSISGVPFQSAYADAIVSQTLFYTTFGGGPNIHTVNVSYDGANTFTIGASNVISTTPGGDGLAGNPQDSNSLLIGGQGPNIHNVDISLGTFVTTPTINGGIVFHLEIPDANTVYGTGIPFAGIASHPIDAAGNLGVGTQILPAVGSSSVTQIISTPNPNPTYYTNSGSGGNGDFGTITIGATYTTTLISANVPAAHGGTYDPFSNTVILFGAGHITQFNVATGAQVSDLTIPNVQFDQGTVDGMGHLYVADNTGGNLFFLDYSTSVLKEVGDVTNFQSLQFLANQLDDIGPLVGMGTTEEPIGGTILEINSASLLLAGLQSMTIWMAPILAGAAGVAAFYLKSRKN